MYTFKILKIYFNELYKLKLTEINFIYKFLKVKAIQ